MTIKIRSIRARAVDVPLEYPVKTAVGLVASSPLVLIDVETTDGVIGSAYLFAYIKPALKPLAETVDALAPIVIGQPLAPIEIDRLIEQRLRLVGHTGLFRMASAGIDMAIWDALAKQQKQPLYALLGAQARPIRTYDSHSMDGIALATKRAAQAAERGFTGLKTKIGYANVEEDVAVIRAIRAEAGDTMGIMADYNQSLDVPEAIRRGRVLDDENLIWLEEPTIERDYAGHARIGHAIRTPIQMGENWLGVTEMNWAIDAQACAFGMLDIMKIGGVTGWQRAASLALLKGLPLSSHLFQEFSAHLLAATPTAHWLERLDIAGPILEPLLTFKDGFAHLAEQPGAGIVWREDAIAKYSV
ncbi:enolase C-terminal domain-like protein [Sphingomonas sp. NFX23]|uniref:enolase C-terminal domain-like protein n=1 Tax=Sphingomonas sp. NFX23 TaxID=2819532 RepID=UPI003CF4DD7A